MSSFQELGELLMTEYQALLSATKASIDSAYKHNQMDQHIQEEIVKRTEAIGKLETEIIAKREDVKGEYENFVRHLQKKILKDIEVNKYEDTLPDQVELDILRDAAKLWTTWKDADMDKCCYILFKAIMRSMDANRRESVQQILEDTKPQL